MTNTPTYEELQRWMWNLEKEKIHQEGQHQVRRKNEGSYRELLDHAQDLIQSVAPDGSFLYVNHAWLGAMGYKYHELNHITLRDIIHPDHHPECMTLFKRVLAGEKLPRVETRFLTKNGAIITVEGSINCRFSDGEPIATCGIFRNVSECKGSEVALQKNEEQYRELLDHAYDLIHSVAPDGTLLYTNSAWQDTLGYSVEEIKNMSVMDIIDSSCRAKCEEFFKSLLQGIPLDRNEATFVAKDGRRVEVEGRSRCKFENGRPKAILCIYRDITERKLAEEALRESSEKIKRFAYSISHDLKSPAIALHGITRILYNRYGSLFDEKGKRYCRHVLQSSTQITDLVEKINDFIAAKEIPLLVENISLKELCRSIEEEFAERLATGKISWQEPSTMPIIDGDRLALLRVLRNLVDNAIKYGGEQLTTITIDYQQRSTHHILSVGDDGAGIPLDNPEDIFLQFRRRESTHNVAGTGLGLTIVKEIIDRHGGEVRIGSNTGRGTIFYISIAKELQQL